MSKVISADGPSLQEQLHNKTLEDWCATRKEPMEESKRRQHVLQRLSTITKQWIRSIMITEYRMSAADAEEVEGRIFATGSYRYNVHSSGSDIDLVLIAPDRITRRHFFESLVERLREESWITNLVPTVDAAVPIIAMECDGIDIDLSFGSIRRDKVPEHIDDTLLRGLDETMMRSCNAVRVAQLIIDLVPDINTFRQALRFVKYWAKHRGIYSSKFGFPTGIGWAILTAFACQCYPKQNPAGVVCRFFRIYSTWFKPDPHKTGIPNKAIFLTESLTPRNNIGECWDPRNNRRDAQALFPILTPANPYMNACYNVTRTTLAKLCEEFQRGHAILQVAMSKPPDPSMPFGVWSKLIEGQRDEFFSKHKHYLSLKLSTTTVEHYARYVEAAEAKIRFLWFEGGANRGAAMECFPGVRVHVYSSRFEDPEQQVVVDAIRKAEKARQNARMSTGGVKEVPVAPPAPAAPATPGKAGIVPIPVSAASPNNAGAGGAPQQGAPGAVLRGPDGAPLTVPEAFTAHYFFGLEMLQDASGAGKKMDLVGVVKAFRKIVSEIKEYKPPYTQLPVIDVITPSKFPEWLIPKKRERDDAAEEPADQAPAKPTQSATDASAQPPAQQEQEPEQAAAAKPSNNDADVLGMDF